MYHHAESTKKQIIGRKFLSAEKLNDHEIRILCEDGSFDVGVDGDCCSSSVFYDLIVPTQCVGEEIVDVLENSDDGWEKIRREPIVPDEEAFEKGWPNDEYGPDCLSIWDIVLKTKSGEILLRHINNSNGYYDGYTSYRFN
jgi:hypothetical protein